MVRQSLDGFLNGEVPVLIIALCQTKGGSGKSTLAECLAVEAAKDGLVFIADMDPQETTTKWWRRRGGPENPMLVFNVQSLTSFLSALAKREEEPDVLILDTPGSFLGIIRDAVAVADCIVVPVSPGIKDWEAMDTLDSIIAKAKRQASTVYVLNRFRKGTETSKEALIALRKRALVPPVTMALKTDHERAGFEGETAAELNTEAAKEVKKLWATIKKVATDDRKEAKRKVSSAH